METIFACFKTLFFSLIPVSPCECLVIKELQKRRKSFDSHKYPPRFQWLKDNVNVTLKAGSKQHPLEVFEGLVLGTSDRKAFVALHQAAEWSRIIGVWLDDYGVISGFLSGKV